MNQFQKQQSARILACYESGNLEKSDFDSLEKGGKRAFIGEVRKYGNQDWVKHQDGWVLVHPSGKGHILERPGGKREPATDEHIEHAKEHLGQDTSSVAIKNAMGKEMEREEKKESSKIEGKETSVAGDTSIDISDSQRVSELEGKLQKEKESLRDQNSKIVEWSKKDQDQECREAGPGKKVSDYVDHLEKYKDILETRVSNLKKDIKEETNRKMLVVSKPTEEQLDSLTRRDRIKIGKYIYKPDWYEKEFNIVDENGESYGSILSGIAEETNQMQYHYGSDKDKFKDRIKVGRSKLKNLLKKFPELSEGQLSMSFDKRSLLSDDAFKAHDVSDRVSVIFPLEEDNHRRNSNNFKGTIKYNKETDSYTLVGKINGGKDHIQENLSLDEAYDIVNNKNINKIDEDATPSYKLQGELAKGDKSTGKMKEEYFRWGSGKYLSKDQREILQNIFDTNNDGLWKNLEKKDIDRDSLKVEDIDSRFSNERPGYVGMYSGDLELIQKFSVKIDGILYQKIGHQSHSTAGFW